MKKVKELLLFAVSFIVITFLRTPWLHLIVNSGDTAEFIAPKNYLMIWLSDTQYLKSVFSTFFKYFAISFVFVAIFVVLMFLLRNKFKFRRWLFYILCGAAGFVSCLSALCATNIRFWIYIYNYNFSLGINAFIKALGGYALFALQVGVLAAFLVWLVELIASKIKSAKEKTYEN